MNLKSEVALFQTLSISFMQFQIICQNLYWLNFVGWIQKDPVLDTNASPD